MPIRKLIYFLFRYFLEYRGYEVSIMDGATASVAGMFDKNRKTPYVIIGMYVLYLEEK